MKRKGVRNQNILKGLEKLKSKGVFDSLEAKKIGISASTLFRLKREGIIERLAPGTYKHFEVEIDPEYEDFIIACTQFGPDAIISILSALFYYRLLDEAPKQIWIIAPLGKRSHDPKFTIIQTKSNLKMGVKIHQHYKIASLERALVDAFRFASKIGALTAVKATRQAIQEKKTTLQKILRMAQELDAKKHVMRYWEAIAPEHE